MTASAGGVSVENEESRRERGEVSSLGVYKTVKKGARRQK